MKQMIKLPSDGALTSVIILAGEKVRLFRFADVILLQTDCARSASHGRLTSCRIYTQETIPTKTSKIQGK